MRKDKIRVIGLMSGTSRDGMDAALISSDGNEKITCHAAITIPYSQSFAKKLASLCELGERALQPEAQASIAPVEAQLNKYAEQAVSVLLEGEGGTFGEKIGTRNIDKSNIDALAFHGHTIYHAPDIGRTLQIGDAARLAEKTNITVVANFRRRDMDAGGQGAPLAPLYHLAIAKSLRAANPALALKPIVFLNIGGIANITWIAASAEPELEGSMLAFDTGPGNALLDDWVATHSRLSRAESTAGSTAVGLAFDKDGALALKGKCHRKVVEKLLLDPFFAQKPPKSLDRKQFSIKSIDGLSLEDGAKTLTVFLAQTIKTARSFFPEPAALWLLCGGGRKNLAIVQSLTETLSEKLSENLAVRVQDIDQLGFDGDALEAQAFAYLAIRRLKAMPTAYPQLTGAKLATSGGTIYASGTQISA